MQNSSHQQRQERANVEAPLLHPRLQALRKLYSEGVLSAPDVCVAYILAYLQVRFGPGRWLAGRRPAPPSLTDVGDVRCGPSHHSLPIMDERLRAVVDPPTQRDWAKLKLDMSASLQDVIKAARFCQVPEHVAPSLTNFYAGRRPIELLWRVPSSDEVLELQASGQRCVSALVSDKALRTVFGHRDCLEMLIHDLIHIERLVEAGRYWQQIGFFEFLRATVSPQHHNSWSMTLGNRWRLSWRYVSSDMNAVVNHMLQTLKWQLAVAIARAALRDGGFVSVEDEEADAALADEQSDVYPRAALADWEPALMDAGLLDMFEANFSREWSELLAHHVQDVRCRYPGIFESSGKLDSPTCQLGPNFIDWPRPSGETFLAAVPPDIGRNCENSNSSGRAQKSAAVIAHFDELGRRKLCGEFGIKSLVATRGDELEMPIAYYILGLSSAEWRK